MRPETFVIATNIALIANGIIFTIYWLINGKRTQKIFCILVFSYLIVGIIQSKLPTLTGPIQQLNFQAIIICNMALNYFLTNISDLKWEWRKYSIAFGLAFIFSHISNLFFPLYIGNILSAASCSYPLFDAGIRTAGANGRKAISVKILSIIALLYGVVTLTYPLAAYFNEFLIPLITTLCLIICITIAGGQAISEIAEQEKKDIFSKLDTDRKISAAIRLNDLANLSNALREQVIPPITAISKELDTLMIAQAEIGEKKEHLNLVKQGVDAVLKNIEKFKGLNDKSSSPEERIMTIDQLMIMAFDHFQDKYPHVDVAFPLQTDITRSVLDKTGLLAHAVSALLENAWEAKQDDGPESLNCEINQTASKITIKIIDYGSGIQEGISDKIFAPFFTTKSGAKHLGVGLSVARSIVEANGGSISFEQLNTPTTVGIHLPCVG